MASISFVKRPRYVKWLGATAILVSFYVLVLQIPPQGMSVRPIPVTKESGHVTYLLPRPKPPQLTELQQAAMVVNYFRLVDEDTKRLELSEFKDSTSAVPVFASPGSVTVITVSAYGEISSQRVADVSPGASYRYALIGPTTNLILIELASHADGSREFGLGTYQ